MHFSNTAILTNQNLTVTLDRELSRLRIKSVMTIKKGGFAQS